MDLGRSCHGSVFLSSDTGRSYRGNFFFVNGPRIKKNVFFCQVMQVALIVGAFSLSMDLGFSYHESVFLSMDMCRSYHGSDLSINGLVLIMGVFFSFNGPECFSINGSWECFSVTMDVGRSYHGNVFSYQWT